jgi:hypothetical protein
MVFLVLLLIFACTPVSFALEQILNGDFTNNANNWTPTNPFSLDALNAFDQDSGYFEAYGRDLGGSANKQWFRDGTIHQGFPGTDIASDAYATLNLSFQEEHDEEQGPWESNITGSILLDDGSDTLLNTFFNFQNSGDVDYTSTWEDAPEKTILLPAGEQFLLRIKFNLTGWKQNLSYLRVDDISCNISPSGLVASETTDGECFLNWHDSDKGFPILADPDGYKIYRRISESDPWVQIDTSTNSEYTDTSPPVAEAVYYAVSDIDTNGTESPLSPHAIFKPAKLQITKVEAVPTEVTIGQSGIPVKAYVLNAGYSPASLDSIDLFFKDPEVGQYNVTLNSTLPVVLSGGDSTIISFSVSVLDGSIPEPDTIDANATGTNLQTSAVITDDQSDIKHSWLIRSPANLIIQTITTPSIVYRDQKDVEISIEVLNDGEKNAAAYWESTEFLFSSGSYSNIRAVDPMPVTVYSGLTETINYLVDIDIDCATGSCIIDANVSFRDVNLLISSTNYDGAAIPGEWTVVAGVIKTYKGPPQYPSYTIESESFNQGNHTVYASAANLIPLYEYRFRWYDPDGNQVQWTDPPVTTDGNGVINDEYILDPASKLGDWRLIVSNVNTSIPLAETTFEVVTPADISVQLDLPEFVTLDQNFVATMTIINTGGAQATDAEPGTILKLAGNVGDASFNSGPTPATDNIPGFSQATFTWELTADLVGSFTVEGSASGYDENDSNFLEAATQTSNMCTIQTKPNLSVNSVTESYDNVYRNQTGLVVEMEIENTGEAAVYIDSATLSFSAGTHSQSIVSPTPLPFILNGNSTANIVFNVSVAIDSDAVAVNSISGSFAATEVNDPTSTFSISGGTTGSWTILAASGKCSANAGLDPEQYIFCEAMPVFIEFSNLPYGNNVSYKFVIYDSETGLNIIAESGAIPSNPSETLGYQFDVPVNPTIGKWRVAIYDCNPNSGNYTHPADLMGEQFFEIVNQGNLIANLNFSPDSVELGDNVTLTMSLSNSVANSSTIYPATVSTPIITAASDGDISLVSGPDPASLSVSYGSPATFTWVYQTTAHTDVGSLSVTAEATGIDEVTTHAETLRVVSSGNVLSDSILILSRNLALDDNVLDLGIMVCGESEVFNTQLNNTGNTELVSVNWQKSYPTHADGHVIPYAYYDYSPESGFSVATFTNQLSSFTLTMPYNQPAGTYNATMIVYDDLNGDSARTLGEPYDEFEVQVVASECRVVVAANKVIDLGGWPAGVHTASQTFNAFNGGNLELEDLIFTQLTATFTDSEIFVTPMNYGSLATDALLIASISAQIGAETPSTYIATWSIYNNGPGSAADSFQIKFSVGTKDFDFSPSPLDLGNSTPTFTLSNISFDINNTGDLDLTNLDVIPFDLSDGTNFIPADNITFEIPASVPAGETRPATLTLYIPGGTLESNYEGWQLFFDDQNEDGLNSGTANEKESSLLLKVHVNEYTALQVIPSTIDLGGIAPGEPAKEVGFLCKNIGNTNLASMTWEKTNLIYDAFFIDQNDYSFTPPPLFNALPGTVFPATITITIDSGQDGGFYSGSYGWLFDDELLNNRDADDPQDNFIITCQVGEKAIEITTAGPLLATGTPNSVSTEASFSIKNTGDLVLTKPRAILITSLEDGTKIISALQAVFTPETFAYMNAGQSKSGTWAVQIPAKQAVGTYTSTLKVWDDTDNDWIPDTEEASDTINVELRVLSKRVITVTPDPLDFFFVPAGQSASEEFIIYNTGNIDILGPSEIIKALKADLEPVVTGPDSIPTANITIALDPLFSDNLPVGDFMIATVTVSVPPGQASGEYRGTQIIYDDYNTQNGIFDSGTEESGNLNLILTVGQKEFEITPSPTDLGAGDPEAILSVNITAKNLTSVPLSKLKWLKRDLLSDPNSIPGISITYSYPGPFSISSNGSRNIAVSAIIPPNQPPGNYIATHTLFEDEDGDGFISEREASATYELRLTVNTCPRLELSLTEIDMGTLSIGETSPVYEIFYTNTGNVSLENLGWVTNNLTGPTDIINSGIISLSPATSPPAILAPGEIARTDLTLGPIPAGQTQEEYSALQTLRDTAYPGQATDSFLLKVIIQSTDELDLPEGSTYQEIATATFSNTTDEKFFLSAWVCPGTTTAKLSFVETLFEGSVITNRGVEVDENGNITGTGPIIEAGITGQSSFEHPVHGPLNWYRVFISFNYHFDETLSDQTWIVLQNTNSTGNKASVWFDGIQLERAIFDDQTRPTTYSKKQKLVSPSKQLDISGSTNYHEW